MKVDELTEMLKKGVAEVFESEAYKNYLFFLKNFHRYSAANSFLIYLQSGGRATHVAGFHQWKKMGRSVKKGESALWIYAPCFVDKVTKKKDDGRENTDTKEEKDEFIITTRKYFKAVPVFDISQTEGRELADSKICKAIEGQYSNFSAVWQILKSLAGCPVIMTDDLRGYGKYFEILEGENIKPIRGIKIKNSLSENMKIKTLLHEIAHSRLHGSTAKLQTIDKNAAEIEAESIAFIVANYLGVDSSSYSFEYVATWARDNNDRLENALNTIQKTAKELINEIELTTLNN